MNIINRPPVVLNTITQSFSHLHLIYVVKNLNPQFKHRGPSRGGLDLLLIRHLLSLCKWV